jgi:hypothetical protein
VQKLSIESLRRELSPNADSLKSLEADRTDLLAQIAEIDRRLSEQADNPDLLSQRDARSGELAIVEASIARHRERGELVERLFALMSDSSLVVTALSQSPRFSEFLPLLKELDQLFRRRAPVIHEWYDVRSGRGFRLVTTRRNQSYASSGGCGFGWSLIHCTDAKIYAFSLFESPLIAVIPPTMTVDAKPLKMLWSACQGDVSGTGIAMLFEQNRLDMTSVGSGLELPALCMR